MKILLLLISLLAISCYGKEPIYTECDYKSADLRFQNKELENAFNTRDLDKILKEMHITIDIAKKTEKVCQIGSIDRAFAEYIIETNEELLEDIRIMLEKPIPNGNVVKIEKK
jgi:hypothetical protein